MRAELLSIGTELLLGQIVDTNAAYLAGRLAALGIDLHHGSMVGDNLGRVREALERSLSRSQLVVCTGGLGPTEDDLTREAIAATLGETPEVDGRLEADLRAWFAARGMPMPERNRKQAWLIPSARPLPNPLGTAPGWDVHHERCRIVAMPGVPREMTRMWETEVEPTLIEGAHIRSRTLKLLGVGESAVEEALGGLVRSTSPTVATYAKGDGVHVRLTDKDADAAALDARIGRMEREVRSRLGEHVWGADADTLGGIVARALAGRSWRLATAESLSAGDLARTLLEDGGGAWYAGGVVRAPAGADLLAGLAAPLGGEVTLITPHGDVEATVLCRTPDGERAQLVRFTLPAEGRRRSTLAAFDLLRRAVAGR